MPAELRSIPISQIIPAKHQARKSFNPERLRGLAESMKQEGLLNPIVVRKVGDQFELISGERRVRAAKSLSWDSIEAKVITTVSEAEAAAKGLIENIQREDLNPIEEAEGFQDLHQLDPKYWTQTKIAETVGKRQDYVSRSLALLDLPAVVLESMRQRIISREHGVELLRLDNAKLQKRWAAKVDKNQWTVKETRVAVDRYLAMPEAEAESSPIPNAKDEVAQPEFTDPIGDSAWQGMLQSTRGWQWAVQYADELHWTFDVRLAAMQPRDPKKTLGQWFLAMAEAFGETKLDHEVEESVGVSQAVINSYTDILKRIEAGEVKSPSGKTWAELNEVRK
jgi:ParB family transcriptional regulator, chromosome partitioning protein